MSATITRVLSVHAGYACRRSGACCTAGWPIAVEPRVERAVSEAAASGRLQLPVASAQPFVGAPGGAPTALALDGHGRCMFFAAGAPNACAIHRDLGHEWLPSSCRHFPRVSLLTPGAVSVTLSHFCPTAASLLFEGDGELRIVEDAPTFPPAGDYEGLDARGTLPLLRPGVFLDWDAHRLWEEHAVRTLAREDLSPEAALDRLRADAEEARAWTPARGPLAGRIAAIAESPDPDVASAPSSFAEALAAWHLAAACVPEGVPGRPPLDETALTAADARHVAPVWPRHAPPIRRYLAAKAFASWCAVQGEGLRSAVAFVALALGVLRVEAARASAALAAPLHAAGLKQAISAADLLLVHLASPEALARGLGACERGAG